MLGTFGPGSLLPNEADLAKSYNCARATVNRAMQALADEGIVERRRKAGTRVCMAPARQARFTIPIVRSEIEAQGAAYGYQLVSRSPCPAPAWLSTRFSVPDAAPVLHLLCLHLADGQPYQLEDRWINLTALPQAETAGFSEVGPNEWLVETVPFSNAEISFSAAQAGKPHAEHLKCGMGAPLFVIERSTWWEGESITFVRLSFRPGHKMTTRY